MFLRKFLSSIIQFSVLLKPHFGGISVIPLSLDPSVVSKILSSTAKQNKTHKFSTYTWSLMSSPFCCEQWNQNEYSLCGNASVAIIVV